jgi:DHA1 family tetracycline resistance protein-like MFS transporter
MRRSPLVIVYLTVFIDLLGFGIILPALPYYAVSFGATGLWVGALLTAYSAAQFVGAALLGRLSDRVGRRPIILISLVGSAISLTVTGLANGLLVLLLGRALAGLFGGSISAAQAYIADVTEPEERARYMGLLGAAIGLGFVFGPALGAALSPLGFGAAAFVAAGLAAVNLAFAYVKLPESRPPGSGASRPARAARRGLLDALRRPTLGRILAATFLTTFAFVGMETTYALLGQQRFALDTARLGLVFAYVGVVIVVVQGGLIGPIVARYGDQATAVAGAGLLGISLAAIPVADNLVAGLAALGALAVGQGLVTPTLSTLLSRASDADEQGSSLGLGQSLAAGARALGPLVAGWLFDLGAALPYVVGAALSLVVAWLLIGVRVADERRAVEVVGPTSDA